MLGLYTYLLLIQRRRKDMKKKHFQVGVIILSGILFFSIPTNSVSADKVQKEKFSAKYLDFSGKQYEYYTKKKAKEATWQHTAYNKKSSTKRSVTYNVSRKKYIRGSVKTSADFKLMRSGVSVSAEVGVGVEKTDSTTVKFIIPAKKNAKLEYGSQKVLTAGHIVTYSRGNVQSKKAIDGKWTYGSYSSSKEF